MKRAVFALLLVLAGMGILPVPAHALSSEGWVRLQGAEAPLETPKKKLLVVFWATWCVDCRSKLDTTLPELGKRPDVEVLTMNMDRDADRVRDFLKKEKITIPVYQDPSRKLAKELKAYSVPHWAVYERSGADGKVWKRLQAKAAFDEDEVRKALQ